MGIQNISLLICVGFIAFAIYNFFQTGKRFRDMIEGRCALPEPYREFPVHESTKEEYLRLRSVVEMFVNMVKNGQESELILTTEDINTLRTRGITPNRDITNKRSKTLPEYYLISNDEVIERLMIFPYPPGLTGLTSLCLEVVHSIRFLQDGDIWKERYTITAWNGKKKTSSVLRPLTYSKFLKRVLAPDGGAEALENATEVLGKLNSVVISENRLIVKFEGIG